MAVPAIAAYHPEFSKHARVYHGIQKWINQGISYRNRQQDFGESKQHHSVLVEQASVEVKGSRCEAYGAENAKFRRQHRQAGGDRLVIQG